MARPAEPRPGREVALLAALIATAFAVAWLFVRAAPQSERFYQDYFASAVMEACGRGFVDVRDVPAVERFLTKERPSLSCAEIPPDVPTFGPTPFQRVHRYLMGAVAAVWRVRGVSWAHLDVLFAFLYAASAALAYGIFRLGAGRAIAAFFTFLLIFSEPQLRMLPLLRDYSKAPFFLAVLLGLGLLVRRAGGRRRTLALAGALGVAIGVGVGVRRDLLVCVPFILLTLFAFLPGGVTRNLRLKLGAAAVFAAATLISGWPAFTILAEGVNSWHVLILGRTTFFDANLGVEPSVYDIGPFYDDLYVNHLVNGYAERRLGSTAWLDYSTGGYDRAGAAFYRELLRAFPADAIVRSYSAVLRSLDSAFEDPSHAFGGTGVEITETELERIAPFDVLLRLRRRLVQPLEGGHAGAVATIVAIVGLLGFRRREGLFAALAVLYFAGYTSLVFFERHYFHVQVLAYWAAALVISGGVRIWRGHAGAGRVLRRILSGAGVLAALGLVLAAALATARAWQSRHVAAMVDTVLALPEQPVGRLAYARKGRAWFWIPAPRLPDRATPAWDPLRVRYFDLVLDGSRCGRKRVRARVRYRVEGSVTDLGETRLIPLSRTGKTHLFLPSYDFRPGPSAPRRDFLGFRLPAAGAECVSGLYQVRDIDRIPLLLHLVLPPDWRSGPLFQRVRLD